RRGDPGRALSRGRRDHRLRHAPEERPFRTANVRELPEIPLKYLQYVKLLPDRLAFAGSIQALRRGAQIGASSSMPEGSNSFMTVETDSHPPTEPFAAHEPVRRGGSIVLVLLVAAGIVAVAVALMTIGRAQAQPYILGVLALLAMVGLFNLFAFAAGIIRFTDRTNDDPVMGRIADQAYDGLAVTDPRGHVVYSNAAYLTLTGAAGPQDVRPVERVFIGNPDVSEAVFRLLKAGREGKRQQEEVRIAGQDGSHG